MPYPPAIAYSNSKPAITGAMPFEKWPAPITDATGNLVESLSYDPCKVKLGFCERSETKALVEPISLQPMQREGRRRNPNNWTDYNVTTTLFDRGFTGHEHLLHFGLINPEALHCISLSGLATANFSLHCVRKNQASANMNGRVYDPFLARFLSPDPFVQAPGYTQNYNRYSYAFNNPLKYTDPSGYYVFDPSADYARAHTYLDGSGGGGMPNPRSFANNWCANNGRVGGFGPGSGKHWSDEIRTPAENFERLSPKAFDRLYGAKSYESIVSSIRTNAESGRLGKAQNNDVKVLGFWYVDRKGNPVTNSRGISGEAWAIEVGYFDLLNYISGLTLREIAFQADLNGWYSSTLIPIGTERAIGLAGSMWGSAATMTYLDEVANGVSVTSKGMTYLRLSGNILGGLGFGATSINNWTKIQNGTINTADYFDWGVSGSMLLAGVLITNPVGLTVLAVGGIGYSVYRLSAGNATDLWINENFGFRP